ncbi:unnamed protein product [Dimorphilus gyrociliatus]|uniref:Copper homeostasis protein cutC homolog n=1 Tax=Dimorphilus gyrociliatus TaxID=2664684 RepID=A0A7I8VI24_9ANNE|nr:unnamed protein product [Dimorphilus gyrociliatus]
MLEVCIDSLESALIAFKNGADRLEVCSCLIVGGLTPTIGLVKLIKERVDIPIHVLIRPRQGDFVYNEEEVQTMIEDIKIFKELGVGGVVIGALTIEDGLDKSTIEKILKVADGLHLTFHRAFDQVKEPSEIVEQLIHYGFKTILTSGLKSTALEGIDLLKELLLNYGNRICIMPGSGINLNNFLTIKKHLTNITWFHLSSKKLKTKSLSLKVDVGNKINGESDFQNQVYVTDGEQLRQIKDLDK